MRKIKRFAHWLFERLPHLTIFLSGFLIPVFLKSISQLMTPGAAFFSIAFPLFAAFAITTLLYLRIQISQEVDRGRLTVRFYPKSPEAEGDAEVYDPIIYRIRGARRSVKVLGALRDPSASSSSARQRYFREIENIIQKRVNEGKDFVYERLVQVDLGEHNPSGASYSHVTSLCSSTVDQLTFEHCKRSLQITEISGKVQVFLRQTPPVMPIVTLILIDEDYVILCLPWLEKNGVNELDTQQLGKGFVFHDVGSGLYSEMAAMFNVAKFFSPPIHKFIDDRDEARTE